MQFHYFAKSLTGGKNLLKKKVLPNHLKLITVYSGTSLFTFGHPINSCQSLINATLKFPRDFEVPHRISTNGTSVEAEVNQIVFAG